MLVTLLGIVTSVNAVHALKAFAASVFIQYGSTISFMDGQLAKQLSGIAVKPVPSETSASSSHELNALFPILVTESGITSFVSPSQS